jgi:Ca2+-transporting ATPase
MERKPRPEKEPILDRALLLWLCVAGLVMGGTTLGVIWWADDAHGTAVARTMGMTTFAIANVFLSYCVKSDLVSVFDASTYADRRLLKATGLSAVAILLGAELGICQRILGTVSLTGKEWIVCILAALTIVVVSEARKLLLRHRQTAPSETEAKDLAVPRPATST